MDLRIQIETLTSAIPSLDQKSRGFAQSLCDQFMNTGKRPLSDKQVYWVGVLLDRAAAPPPAQADVGSLQPIVDLLARAASHLKHPAIVLRAGARDFRLNIAGPNAKVPGSINICAATNGIDGREWYGRVSGGKYEARRNLAIETSTAIAVALRSVAQDPAKAASEYGHLTGRCCFCSLPLTDARSTHVGYGKICASHYGLPYPTAKEAANG